jgi:putative NIF3 family GTP cyclohydrolase 1 type 2
MRDISRREFGALLATGLAGGRFAAPLAYGTRPMAAISAGDVIERLRRDIGVEWKAETIDGVKAGETSTVVTGVVTTAMATMGVLRQAVAAGANFVVTTEPTFYGRADARNPPAAPGAAPPAAPSTDPVYAAKSQLIDSYGLVVFRLNEHWRLRSPDPFAQGLAARLGWSSRQVAGDPSRYDVPPVALESLAGDVKTRLGARGGIRVVGDPRARVRRVALLPGSTPLASSLATLPAVDVIVAGEVREWESVEYARDFLSSGQAKALVLLGRVVSEEPGMGLCAQWLTTLVPEVPVRHAPAGDPYWRPAP